MTKYNHLGLNDSISKDLVAQLGDLLANYSVFYQNVRGYHWNIKGSDFFELHVKFEELYDDLVLKIDEIAERILTLGGAPNHSFTSYLQQSEIVESSQVANGKKGVEEVLASFKVLLIKQRNILSIASEGDDEGTSAMMSDYIREQEKLIWMYSAFLNK